MTTNSSPFWITGLVPATFTPLQADGSLNLAVVAPMVEHLIRDGVTGLYVCGSTGEGPSLTREERMATTEAFVAAAQRRIPVVVQVGHNSIAEARLLAAHAQAAGADAISATPPSYFRPPTPAALIDCMAEIAASAPALPFYYYHIPVMTGVTPNVAALLREGSKAIPTLVGVKFSHTAVYDLQAAVAVDNGRFNLLFGSDEMLLSGMCGGAHGAVGSTYNFAAPLFNRILAAFAAGDLPEARRLQGHAVEMVNVLVRHGGNAAIKAVMALLNLDCGPVRLPQVAIGVEQQQQLRQELDANGFFQWGRSAP
jgi:N-acetylneuraminate lyase